MVVTPLAIAPSVALAEREAAETARLVAEHAARVAGTGTGSGGAIAAGGVDDLVVTIAPKKVNWDLKRDVARKLELLEKQTRRAMAELVREQAAAARGAAAAAAAPARGAGGSSSSVAASSSGGVDDLPAGMDAAVFARAVAQVGQRRTATAATSAGPRPPRGGRWDDDDDDDDEGEVYAGGGLGLSADGRREAVRDFDAHEAAAAVTKRGGGRGGDGAAKTGAEDIDIDDF